jgi:hypothetical protein
MKVSRKVGRRSRKYTSSISRRKLRNKKNKKYTRKGGKYRNRVRTHAYKRGKKFHRGGVNFLDTSLLSKSMVNRLGEQENMEQYATIKDASDLNKKLIEKKKFPYSQYGERVATSIELSTRNPELPDKNENYASPIITLRCQKKNRFAQNQQFRCYINYSRSDKNNSIQVFVSFTRKDDDNINFVFKGTPQEVVSNFKNLSRLQEVVAKTGPSLLFEGGTYSFNFMENEELLNAIAAAIESHQNSAETTLPQTTSSTSNVTELSEHAAADTLPP